MIKMCKAEALFAVKKMCECKMAGLLWISMGAFLCLKFMN